MGRYKSVMIVSIVLFSMVSMGVDLATGQDQSGQVGQQSVGTNCQSRFNQMDANQDGVVTQDEFMSARHAPRRSQGGFAAKDVDHSGGLSVSEFCAGKAGDCPSRFNRLDANHDGVITKDELKAVRRSPQEVFNKKDADGNGSLTVDEFCSGRRRGMRMLRTQ